MVTGPFLLLVNLDTTPVAKVELNPAKIWGYSASGRCTMLNAATSETNDAFPIWPGNFNFWRPNGGP